MGSSNNNNNTTTNKYRNKSNTNNENKGVTMRKVVLGLGFWVQGLRCLPWMAVNFFLKDGLKVDPSTLQLLQNSANLPMVAKPIYGLLSDSVYISGQHRIPYIAIGGIFFFFFFPFVDLLFFLIIRLITGLCTESIFSALLSNPGVNIDSFRSASLLIPENQVAFIVNLFPLDVI